MGIVVTERRRVGFARKKTALNANNVKPRKTRRRRLDIEDGNGGEKRKTA